MGALCSLNTLRLTFVAGIRPEEFEVIVCKGVNSPIAAYKPLTPDSNGIIFANTAGLTTADLDSFE